MTPNLAEQAVTYMILAAYHGREVPSKATVRVWRGADAGEVRAL
jgi:hypothetical protein